MEHRQDKPPSPERRARTAGPARGGGAPEDARRKSLPPEKTHAEEFYLLKQMGSRHPMVFVFEAGDVVRGRIEWYDRDCIKVHRDDGPNLLIYKRHLRYIYKDEEGGPLE